MSYLAKLKRLDVSIVLLVTILCLIGALAIYEATWGTALAGHHWEHLMMFGTLSIVMLVVALFNYRLLTGKLAYVIYAVGIVLLVLVEFFGVNINGATRWLRIQGYQFQPSEIAKLSTLVMAAHLMHRRDGEQLRFWKDLVPLLVVFALPVLLIMRQPDLGTALVFAGMALGMLWIGNIRALYMGIAVAIGASMFAFMVWLYQTEHPLLEQLVKPHQLERIETFLDPSQDPDNAWHVLNAMQAIGIGGLHGSEGFMIRNGYVPYTYSDSIFVVIGEKYGFLGAAAMLTLFFILVYRMMMTALESASRAGAYLTVGVICLLVFQVFVNVGMHIGLLPLTGLSLPFISYGGSSLLTVLLSVGLVLSVRMHGKPDDKN